MPKRKEDLIGQKFGRWVVLRFAGKATNGGAVWYCKCDCGKEKNVRASFLKNGDSKSCGCYQKEVVRKIRFKHGYRDEFAIQDKTKKKTYNRWVSIIRRCKNKNHSDYPYYGGRGITVCERWLDFKNFLEDMGNVPEGLQLDRIDNNKGYSKKNCRWATPKENNRNKRNNRLITYNKETRPLVCWSEKFNLSPQIIKARLKRKWSIDKLFQPKRKELIL